MFSIFRLLFCLQVLLFAVVSHAQGVAVPLHAPAYEIINRLDIMGVENNPVHSEIKGFNRADIAHLALRFNSTANGWTALDRQDLKYLIADNNEYVQDSLVSDRYAQRKGWRKYFYPSPANFLEVNTPDFQLRVNPLLNLSLGKERPDSGFLMQNQRGLELRGVLDQKLFFYTNLLESQVRYPGYVRIREKATASVPGVGFFKKYQSRLLDIQDAYDFNVATAYIGFQITRHFGVQLGHGKHFIGNGYRSLFLSDFSAPTFYLQFDTRVWKLHYQNLFLELSPVSQVQIPDGTLLPKKYAAIHYLNLKWNRNFSVGLFEATIFNRSRQLEWQYLNPVIFYRTVEGMIGSPDNVLLGLDAHWNFLHHFQVYAQWMLDELKTTEFFKNSGWWANKWALQTGLKYVNAFGVDHLDLQMEYNLARPYTYSHHDPYNSYTHYNQALAHPLGANFSETIFLVRWQSSARLCFQARTLLVQSGENSATENWGADPLLDYATRVQDYGNRIGQGVKTSLVLTGLDASYQIGHNIFLDAQALYRRKDSADPAKNYSSVIWGLGFRMNMWNAPFDF